MQPATEELAGTLVRLAGDHRGDSLTDAFKGALNAFTALETSERATVAVLVADRLETQGSPAGAGFLAVGLGVAVEQGDDAAPNALKVAECFRRFCLALAEAAGDGGAAEPNVESDLLLGVRLLGNALVTHLAHAPDIRRRLAADDAFLGDIEPAEPLSVGVAWVLHLLNQQSGALVVVDVEKRQAARVRYENIANCFQLFTLLQEALAGVWGDGRTVNPDVMAVARGQSQAAITDEAWWHYGQFSAPEPDIVSMVQGDAPPDAISQLDGTQVMLLWPPLLGSRTWDGSFLSPCIEAAPSRVVLNGMLSPEELGRLWERLALPDGPADTASVAAKCDAAQVPDDSDSKRRRLVGTAVVLIAAMAVLVPWLTTSLVPLHGYLIALLIYWIVFCLPGALYFIGRRNLGSVSGFSTAGAEWVAPAVGFQVGLALLSLRYTLPENVPALAIVLALTLGLVNGVLEEAFWRGAFHVQSRGRWSYQLLGLGLFTLWHVPLVFAYGIVFPGGAAALLGGAFAMGLFWTLIARRTGSFAWPAASHAVTNMLVFVPFFALNLQ